MTLNFENLINTSVDGLPVMIAMLLGMVLSDLFRPRPHTTDGDDQPKDSKGDDRAPAPMTEAELRKRFGE